MIKIVAAEMKNKLKAIYTGPNENEHGTANV